MGVRAAGRSCSLTAPRNGRAPDVVDELLDAVARRPVLVIVAPAIPHAGLQVGADLPVQGLVQRHVPPQLRQHRKDTGARQLFFLFVFVERQPCNFLFPVGEVEDACPAGMAGPHAHLANSGHMQYGSAAQRRPEEGTDTSACTGGAAAAGELPSRSPGPGRRLAVVSAVLLAAVAIVAALALADHAVPDGGRPDVIAPRDVLFARPKSSAARLRVVDGLDGEGAQLRVVRADHGAKLLSNMAGFSKIAQEATDAMIKSDEHQKLASMKRSRVTMLGLHDPPAGAPHDRAPASPCPKGDPPWKPCVNPFPSVRFNVFDPMPEDPPHHRWTQRRLREEAARLLALVSEAKSWENDKYSHEVSDATNQSSYLKEALSNISNIEGEAMAHMNVIYKGLKEAESGIDDALRTSKTLVSVMDHDENSKKLRVWGILEQHGNKLDYNKVLQQQYDLVEKAHIYDNEKLDEVQMNRYDSDVDEKSRRVQGWVQGLRGRIALNVSHFKQQAIRAAKLTRTLRTDERGVMDESWENGLKLKSLALHAGNSTTLFEERVAATGAKVLARQHNISRQISTATATIDGAERLLAGNQEQTVSEEDQMQSLETEFTRMKDRLGTLMNALATVENAINEEVAAHTALKAQEDAQMQTFRESVSTMEPQIKSILDLSQTVSDIEGESDKGIGEVQRNLAVAEAAKQNSESEEANLNRNLAALFKAVNQQQAILHSNSTRIDYADLQSSMTSVNSRIELVKALSGNVQALHSMFITTSKNLTKQIEILDDTRKRWRNEARIAHTTLTAKADGIIAMEKASEGSTQKALTDLSSKIKAAKEWKLHMMDVYGQLRQELAATTQSLVALNNKFSKLYGDLESRLNTMQTQSQHLGEPEEMKVGTDNVDMRAQQSLDSVKELVSKMNHLRAAEKDERDKLKAFKAHLRATKTDIKTALGKASQMLRRHPNLFERISCVCYDGDVLNGKCIAGSLSDTSTCDICPAGSWCVRGEAYPCKTTCPGGQILKGECKAGSVSDVTTCEPSPESLYSQNGKSIPCRTTCEPGEELRGTCPAGSDHDSTRCSHCPAGFFCQDGVARECKTSCSDGLVLTGTCKRGMAQDTTTCEPSPAGHYSTGGVAVPCKSTCPDGQLLVDQCPQGSTQDTSHCIACPDGHYCKGGMSFPCRKTCADGEELSGQCPVGSSDDVTVCTRCPEGYFCIGGNIEECKKTCAAGQELTGRCRKGSSKDTTECKPCKEDFFCTNGLSTPCQQSCAGGLVLQGKCAAGSAQDTTICSPCPVDHFCDGSTATECKKSCWEGKILNGQCGEGSSSDTTTCDKCPANYYCKRGIAYECKSQCPEGMLLEGVCEAGSSEDRTHCAPCPAGSFCKGGKRESCKSTCPDGQLLQGFCRAGSSSDKTECVPCPQGSFCVDGKSKECVKTCPSGQKLTGTCAGDGSTVTTCEPCSAGAFCRDGKEEQCKSTCPDGYHLEGSCAEGSSRDKTRCRKCGKDEFCVDGQRHPCKETCPSGQQLLGDCKAGSTFDTTTCAACPAGSFCRDGRVFPCKNTCPLGEVLVGECAAGSESDSTECKPCPAGHFCRDGVASACRTSCPEGQKIDTGCAQGSIVDAECKPCRAGVFCVGAQETPCRVSCDPGLVLEGFCPSGSKSDVTSCTPVPRGSYAIDGEATLCKSMCPPGQLLSGTCAAGSTEDTVACIPCPEGSWCADGAATPCTSECPNGKLLTGTCAQNSEEDSVSCEPCPAGHFCADSEIQACKTMCEDGKMLEGECSIGSSEDTTHCTPCPAGVYCNGGSQVECAKTCPDGKELIGFCSAGSTQDTTTCEPCPPGFFCKGGEKFLCKTSCDDGEVFQGECLLGSTKDMTTCDVCPVGFFCQEGMKKECKKTCPDKTVLEGACVAGSVTDTTMCVFDRTPEPLAIHWWNDRTGAEAVEEQFLGANADTLGAETRLTCLHCGKGHLMGRKKLPISGAKWLVQFYAAWPDYDPSRSKDMPIHTFPAQGFGKQIKDTIRATMNGVVVEMARPSKLGRMVFFQHEFEGDELAYRFDFTSETREVLARPYIVGGEVTILRDSTTGDEGRGAGSSSGGMIKGYILDAIDGKKIRNPGRQNNGFEKRGLIESEDTRLLLFKNSQLVARVPIQSRGGKYKFKVADGQYTCLATLHGMNALWDPHCHVKGEKLQKDIVFSPILAPGMIRVVLTWGASIKDLDSYMLVPHEQVTDPPCEVNWKTTACHSGAVHLDQDSKSGFGPETITIDSLRPGRYRYRVSEYHGLDDNRLMLQKAQIQAAVYTAMGVSFYESEEAGSESEPTAGGFIKGESWYIFTIDGTTGRIYPCTADTCGHGFHDLNNRGRR